MNWKDKGRLFARKLMHLSLLREVLRRLSMAGFLPPAIWKRLPVEVVFPVKLPDGRSFFYSATLNDVIARALYWRGLKDWESETIPVFLQDGAIRSNCSGHWSKYGLLYTPGLYRQP